MLGRGVKRKWSCLEELEAEVMEEKQQIGDEEEEVEVEVEREDEFLPTKPDMSHLQQQQQQQQQRQRVLGLCLEKLQRYQAGMELSLRRSVLLINTLRQIQEEMRSDEGARAPDAVHPDSCLLRDDFREDVSLTCPGCAEDEAEGEKSPELPSQEVNISAAELQKPPPPPAATVTSFSDAVNAMGYLSDLTLDDIFDDIDTSMYETSDLPSAWSSGSLWPVSVSLWPDEDAKVRPGGHSSAGSLQSCLLDLNDLDHIMEILVKS